MPTKIRGPKCEDCGRRMWWGELLRTWVCRNCGYFLNNVDPVTGEIEPVRAEHRTPPSGEVRA